MQSKLPNAVSYYSTSRPFCSNFIMVTSSEKVWPLSNFRSEQGKRYTYTSLRQSLHGRNAETHGRVEDNIPYRRQIFYAAGRVSHHQSPASPCPVIHTTGVSEDSHLYTSNKRHVSVE